MDKQIFEQMHRLEERHWWFVARRKIIARAIRCIGFSKDIKILDAGCGNGDNLSFLSGLGDVTALEKDPEALTRARARACAEVYQGYLPDNLPAELGHDFDLVALLDVLEHIDDDRGSLAKITGLIRADGKILITVPAYQWLWSEHDDRHHHKRRYSKKELTSVLNDSGLIVSHITYFNTLLFPLAVLERLKQKIRPGPPLALPPPLLNACLERIFSLEERWIDKFPFPYGLSLLAVARKR